MNPILVGSLAFSILVSIFLLTIGVDEADGVVIGLVLATISLVVDLLLRLNKMERRLLAATRLSQQLAADQGFFNMVLSIVGDYRRLIDRPKHPLFAERAKYAVTECVNELHHLVEGHMVLPPLSQFSFGLKQIDQIRESIRATSYVDAESFWNSVAGEKYFQSNVALVARQVEVTRVFISDRANVARLRDIILRHKQARMRVLIAFSDEIPRELCEDYLIADGTLLTQLQLTREGHARTERISVNDHALQRATDNFDRLMRGAYEFEDVFPDADDR